MERRARAQEPIRTWTSRSGQQSWEAALVEVKGRQVILRKKDGSKSYLPFDRFSDDDLEYLRQRGWKINAPSASDEPGKVGDGNTANPPPDGEPAVSPPPAKSTGIVVTGVGTDPEKAVQDAFTKAIEQTVGVLVTSESKVEDDQLHEEVLTFSRGFVKEYKVLREWQKDGLHYAEIQAAVNKKELVKRLLGAKSAAIGVQGDLAARQIAFDVRKERLATRMFEKSLAGFDMAKFTKVEILEQETIRDGDDAKIRIKTKVYPDLKQWKEFAQDVRVVLDETSTRRLEITTTIADPLSVKKEDGRKYKQQLEGGGVLVGLLTDVAVARSRMQVKWAIFRVPESFLGPIKSSIDEKAYKMAYTLLDGRGGVVLAESDELGGRRKGAAYVSSGGYEWRYIAPCWRGLGPDHAFAFEMETIIPIRRADLAKVAKIVARLEDEHASGKRSHRLATRSAEPTKASGAGNPPAPTRLVAQGPGLQGAGVRWWCLRGPRGLGTSTIRPSTSYVAPPPGPPTPTTSTPARKNIST